MYYCKLYTAKFMYCGIFDSFIYEGCESNKCEFDRVIWKGDVCVDCDWHIGTFHRGIFEGSSNFATWHDGIFVSGTMDHVIWKGGEWKGGEWKGGQDKDGKYHKEGDSPDKWNK